MEEGLGKFVNEGERETCAEEPVEKWDMEEGLREIAETFENLFALPHVDIKTYSPLTLAYMGDGIYELIIRTILVKQGNAQAGRLHKRASSLVKASAQAAMLQAFKEDLTEEELAVFKRGRNAHPGTMAKNATVSDYKKATGFEALMGYLYLKGDWERLFELVRQGLTKGEFICDMKHLP